MFKALKERFRDKARDEFCTYLASLGIDVEMVEKGSPEDIGKTSFADSDLGSIRVRGEEIDIIQVSSFTDSEGDRTYQVHYAVKADVKGREEGLKAETKWKAKGLIRRQLLGFEWTGGEIAKLLNKDRQLNDYILEEKWGFKLHPDKKGNYVRIFWQQPWGAPPKSVLEPSKKEIECYNTIARHIRKFLSTS